MNEETLLNIYNAYNNGVMSEPERLEYEADVQSGKIALPSSVAGLKPSDQTSPAAPAPSLDQGIIDAYSNDLMTREDKIELEKDVAEGKWTLPEGVQLGSTEPLGFFGSMREKVTGTDRMTSEMESLPQWTAMPEMQQFGAKNFKAGMGTLMTDADETVQVMKANFPGIAVRRDTKGNYIMKSSVDGQEYAYTPGFTMGDIPRVGGLLASFTPAGRASTLGGSMVAGGATQAAIETSQAAVGGNFDPEQIPIAGAAQGGGFLLGKAMQAGGQKMGKAYERFVKPKPTPATPAAASDGQLTSSELATITKKASSGGIGSGNAVKELVEQASPDLKVLEAAKRLGIEDYLQPDHVTTNQVFREVFQAVKSSIGSKARQAELEGLKQVSKKANDIIEDISGTTDMSMLDSSVKSAISKTQTELDIISRDLWKNVNNAIGPKTPAPANNLMEYLIKKADDMGGFEKLNPMEKALIKKLTNMTTKELDEGGEEALSLIQSPTYALLDSERKALTSARIKKQGEYKDADSALVRKLETQLLEDQKAVAESLGVLDQFTAARQSTAMRKSIEDDMISLFGKNIDGTIIGDLSSSMKKLAIGDVSKFTELLKKIPDDIREKVVASGLNTAFGKNASNKQINFNSFTNWYEGLLDNKKAHTALMSNLPSEARKLLSDLYRVSRGIRNASRERITTGRINSIRDELKGADGLMESIYSAAKRSAGGLAAEMISTPAGVPGAGLSAGITSALTKGKTDVLKAADKLISTPEFVRMAMEGTPEAAAALAKTTPFKTFFSNLYFGESRAVLSPEDWILAAYKSGNLAEDSNNSNNEE